MNDPEWFESYVVKILGEDAIGDELMDVLAKSSERKKDKSMEQSKGKTISERSSFNRGESFSDMEKVPGSLPTGTTEKEVEEDRPREAAKEMEELTFETHSSPIEPIKMSIEIKEEHLHEVDSPPIKGKEEICEKQTSKKHEVDQERTGEALTTEELDSNMKNTKEEVIQKDLTPGSMEILSTEADATIENAILTNASDASSELEVVDKTVSPSFKTEKDQKVPTTDIATVINNLKTEPLDEEAPPTAPEPFEPNSPPSVLETTLNMTSKRDTMRSNQSTTESQVRTERKAPEGDFAEPIVRTVVFTNPFNGKPVMKSFEIFQDLGYTKSDIQDLQTDVVALIANDGIVRPKSGIPKRWRLLPDTKNDVEFKTESIEDLQKIQSNRKSEDKTETDRFQINRGTSPTQNPRQPAAEIDTTDRTEQREIDTEDDSASRRKRQQPDLNRDMYTGSIQNPIETKRTLASRGASVTSEQRRAQLKTELDRDGKRKRIYDGRPKRNLSGPNRDDPPASSSGFWPDMNTFRELLKTEAKFRLRILGDDWSDAVRDETKWRHDLYKEWLWTLNNGLGEPIIERRSDRARRSQVDGASAPPGAPRPRTKRPRNDLDM